MYIILCMFGCMNDMHVWMDVMHELVVCTHGRGQKMDVLVEGEVVRKWCVCAVFVACPPFLFIQIYFSFLLFIFSLL